MDQKEYKSSYWKLCQRLKFSGICIDQNLSKKSRIVKYSKTHPIPVRRSDLVLINKKRRTFHYVDYVVPEDHGVKIKQKEKIDKYLNLAREF